MCRAVIYVNAVNMSTNCREECSNRYHCQCRNGIAYLSIGYGFHLLFATDAITTDCLWLQILLQKRTHLIPSNEHETAEDTAELLLNFVFKYHGLPRSIHSDRAPVLMSETWDQYWAAYRFVGNVRRHGPMFIF